MYTDYFGLQENPFSIAPDPRYLYLSGHHCEALAHLRYGMQTNGGFVLLTGEVGAGKTTLCRSLLDQLPKDVVVAFVLNPKVTVIELLETICDELQVDYSPAASNKQLVDRLTGHLIDTHAQGQKTVLIIDEAQNLTIDVLEQLRLLTNLETARHKLLQIVLLGQPELRDLLARSDLRQLAQRITARYHLQPLPSDEIMAYVTHRLEVAGCTQTLFPPKLANLLCCLTKGVPRLINLVCDRALLGAYACEQRQVDRSILRQAAREVFDLPSGRNKRRASPVLAAVMMLLLLVGTGWGLRHWWTSVQVPPPVPVPSLVASTSSSPPGSPASISNELTEVPLPLNEDWPQTVDMQRNRAMAFADLLHLWGVEQPPLRQDFCSAAAEFGLSCLIRQDSLENLRRLDRPAILTLYDNEGQPFYPVLAELVGSRAYFLVGQTTVSLDISILETRWFGDFLLVWQDVDAINSYLRPGEKGPGIDWLKTALADLGHYQLGGQEKRLDGALLAALKQFQLRAGLTPDGVLGPLTMIYLSNALGKSGPRLRPGGAS